MLTVNFTPFTGGEGFLLLNFTLDGTTSQSGGDFAVGYANVGVGPDLEQDWVSQPFVGSVNGVFGFPKTFTFIYGQPFGLYFYLTAGNGAGPTTDVIGTASANFGETLVLSGITIEDSSGNVLNGAQITSASGTQYGANGVLAPEAASWLLLSLSLCAFWGTAHLNDRRLKRRG